MPRAGPRKPGHLGVDSTPGGVFSTITRLGRPVNGAAADGFPDITPDGSAPVRVVQPSRWVRGLRPLGCPPRFLAGSK
jgi:hypothetical protein